jgi:hypothetical protein
MNARIDPEPKELSGEPRSRSPCGRQEIIALIFRVLILPDATDLRR